MPRPTVLTAPRLAAAIAELTARDADLRRVVTAFGAPPMWRRDGGFATLVLLILEQQVSLASARATFEKLAQRAGTLAPARVLALDDAEFRAAGVSRQKTAYVRALAEAVAAGTLDVDSLPRLSDEAVRAALVAIKGIGPWTVDVYLLMVLRRPDVWPSRDLALAVAAHEVKGLRARPAIEELDALGEAWRPWRAVAARILWHHYLNTVRQRRAAR
ncbi:MAG: DNA-3-methyladenine glycosylase 2 family protein [Alphaproteobacteria bacterium]|nr:DNA-3-methyladenine glycosylase 2 family protein [Alphaproteobacteria bacterium]